MKNIILSVIAIIFSLTAIGQVPQYFNSWMFPEVVNQGCITIPFSSNIISHGCGLGNDLFTTAYAQPYFTDSIISIKGIAILGAWSFAPGHTPDSNYKFFLQIRDSSLNNILAQVRYDTIVCATTATPPWSKFTEVLFDSSIFINSNKFYAALTLREINTPSNSCNTEFLGFASFHDSCTVTENPQKLVNGQWEDVLHYGLKEPFAAITIFPILDTLTYHGQNGLSEISNDMEINIYPNPAKDFVYVDIEANNFSKAEIELYDIQGKMVKRAKLKAKEGNRVDISSLKAGAYTYNVSLNGKTISGKVIVGE